MPELRWILLGLGALFCAGLWIWETRRRRQASGSLREFDSDETSSSSHPARWKAGDEYRTEDFAVEQDSPRARMEPTLGDAIAVEDSAPAFDDLSSDETSPHLLPPANEAEASVEADDMPPDEILSLRVLAPPSKPFEGRELIRALHAAGLEHGKFSIFHKYDIDGRTLFSVASLVEPGSFDLRHIDGQSFRGVTFFTLAKGSSEAAPLAMKLAAQDLADRLQGTVQESAVHKDARN